MIMISIFRPDLADQPKVGFFGLDRASQTDVTEIVDLKEMTEVIQILLQVNLYCVNLALHLFIIMYNNYTQSTVKNLQCEYSLGWSNLLLSESPIFPLPFSDQENLRSMLCIRND